MIVRVLPLFILATNCLAANDFKVIHVFVPLCDNKNQGIVPVSASLGNGQDPDNNLYWGARYGVRTFFRHSTDWREIESPAVCGRPILQRTIFKNENSSVYVVSDAYDGSKMKQALTDFLSAAAGQNGSEIGVVDGERKVQIQTGGRATMVCFVGHDGLMDMNIELPQRSAAKQPACAMVLACKSDAYFSKSLRSLGCKPLLMTTGLMAPEAYVLDAAIRSWAGGDEAAAIRKKAAASYAHYQKIDSSAAERLFICDR